MLDDNHKMFDGKIVLKITLIPEGQMYFVSQTQSAHGLLLQSMRWISRFTADTLLPTWILTKQN